MEVYEHVELFERMRFLNDWFALTGTHLPLIARVRAVTVRK